MLRLGAKDGVPGLLNGFRINGESVCNILQTSKI